MANGAVLITLWEQEQNVLGLLGTPWLVLGLLRSETYALRIAEPGAGTMTNRRVNTSCVNSGSLSVLMAHSSHITTKANNNKVPEPTAHRASDSVHGLFMFVSVQTSMTRNW